MKKFLKKQIVIIALIMFFILPIITIANSETYLELVPKKSASYEQWEKLDKEEKNTIIPPTYIDINFKDSIKRSKYNQYILKSEEEGTSSYNLKTELAKSNIGIYVKNQQQTGSCWAFSFSNMIETTIANKFKRTVKEYSPMHIDYMAGALYNRIVGDGGNYLMALAYGTSGLGPVYEEDFSFESVYDEVENSSQPYFLTNISNVQLDKEAKARIKDATIFAPIYKSYSTNSITYKDSSAWIGYNEYEPEEVQALRLLVKEHIKENGAITAMMYTNSGNITSMYNSTTKAFFNNSSFSNPDHAVTIVGWDDTFPKENFLEGKRPINDGAYIVLNSWGEEFGDSGYFYISYDDAVIEQDLCGIVDISEKEDEEDSYDNIYAYDELGANYSVYVINDEGTQYLDSGYAASVFSRESKQSTEYLSEIGIFLFSAHGIEIYVNPNDGKLEDCELVATFTATQALEGGYHSLKLSSPIQLTGDNFAIKIKYINSTRTEIPLEYNGYASGSAEEDDPYATATASPNESFISFNGTVWSDLDDYSKTYYAGTSDETTIVLKDTSACIKAFTTLSEGTTTVPVTGVTLDKETVTIKEEETETLVATVTPENATNQNITWSSNNQSVATVANGVVTGVSEGTATITVTTQDGNFTDTCVVTVEEKVVTPPTVAVTGVTLNKETVTIKEEGTTTLVATVMPENATNQNVTWSSSDNTIATVENGVVTGVSAGTATITVTTQDGSFTDTCVVTVEEKVATPTTVAVTGVTLNKETVTIKEEETTTLVATVTPENATNQNVTWSSSAESVATVANGVVTGVSEGTATITVTTQDGNFTDTCVVTVEEKVVTPTTVPVTGVTLDKETVTVKEEETETLVATVMPENATNKNITWSSNNESVATVANGVVTGLSAGTATITVTTQDGSFTDTCVVTVEEAVLSVKVTGIELDKTELKMQVSEKTNLVATIKPTNATNKEVVWTSSNTDVATISENGIIEALKTGKTTITVTTKDGNYKATCKITVSEKTNNDDDIYAEKEPGKIEEGKDTTIIDGNIPNAGLQTLMMVLIIVAIIVFVTYKKYKTFEDIK